MSLIQTTQISYPESEEYRVLVHEIYCQFRELYNLMCKYKIEQSAFYLKLAYKCYEDAVAQDLINNP